MKFGASVQLARQTDGEARTLAQFAVYLDARAVRVQDHFRQGQSDAGTDNAPDVGPPLIPLEETRAILIRNAYTLIGDGYNHSFRRLYDFDLDQPSPAEYLIALASMLLN